MLDKIKQLEKIARQLEPDGEERATLRGSVIDYTENFLEQLPESPAYRKREDQGSGICDEPIGETPMEMRRILSLFENNVVQTGVNPASPGYLAYIPGGGIYHAALGDYLAAITNRYAGLFFASPGAVRIENILLRWLAQVVGYDERATGNLTSGGSIANLIGIVAARESCDLKAKDFETAVIYLTGQVHHCIFKSIRTAGLKECILRYVSLDEQYRMQISSLEEMIARDRKAGLRPWLIIASAGTTDVGAVDPLAQISDIARHNQMWFHIDGAYGGLFALCEEGRKILSGMEKSDSLVVDPHKTLFLPFGSGAVLVRQKEHLLQAMNFEASYLQDADVADEISPGETSPEFTKHFRGLRLWLPLKLLGTKPFCAAVEEKLWLARYFYHEVQKIEGIEVGPYPQLSVVTFRYIPKNGDANAFNQKLIGKIQQHGRVFISSTNLNGSFTIRFSVLCFRSHLDQVEEALSILRQKIQETKDNF